MSRLRRLFVSDRYFFVTCSLYRLRHPPTDDDFSCLAEAIQSARAAHHFLLTAWVFLPDHWHAVIFRRLLPVGSAADAERPRSAAALPGLARCHPSATFAGR